MNETTTDATAIFAPLWRRKWLILIVGVLVGVATYVHYKREPMKFTVTTQLNLGSGAEEQGALNSSQGNITPSKTVLADQATLLTSVSVGEAAHKLLRKEHVFLNARNSKVRAKANTGTDFITITAEARGARAVADLANAYATAYIGRQRAAYQHEVKEAISRTRGQLRRIESAQHTPSTTTTAKGKVSTKPATSSTSTAQAATLASKIDQLESDLAIAGIRQISPAKPSNARLSSASAKRNAIFGFFLGAFLAAIAAYAASRFDRRLRSLSDIEAIFKTQILAALPDVNHPVMRRDGRLVIAKSLREPLRRLHATLQLGDMLEHDRDESPRSILFVSADPGDGRSTLVAGLALVQGDAGERVAVVEADFRRPTQTALLDLTGSQGLAEVLAGTLAVGEAMQKVEPMQSELVTSPGSSEDGGVVTVVESSFDTGSVSALVSGAPVANPPALLARQTMTNLLRSLAEGFDYVLVDAPAPLEVSDVMPLLHVVDGIVIVARVGRTREASAQRLLQLLARTTSAPVLGVVANHVSRSDIARYGFASLQGAGSWSRKLIGR